MTSARDDALAALGLAAHAGAPCDAAAIQRAFERLARRYPQHHFPERFRRLLDARDLLLQPARGWREHFESRSLDLDWAGPRLEESTHGAGGSAGAAPDRRMARQDFLRAAYLAEPLSPDDDIAVD